ncbi:caspase domain-containing protein [Phycomyces nitens]|nr:caspase domain-containing protein [Phycomyces nitens]
MVNNKTKGREHTKVTCQVTKSRSGKVIEETETVEKHTYINGKKVVTITTTVTKGGKDSLDDDTEDLATTITTVEAHEEEDEEEKEEEKEEGEGDEDEEEEDEIVLEVKDEFLENQPTYFELSNCRGKKRALLIGINYKDGENPLNGCIADAENMKEFLVSSYGFKECDITLLKDDSEDPAFLPTAGNIRIAMGELCRDSKANDSFFFHYSGHGYSVEDDNGDEDMYDHMIRPLCEGSRFTAVFDSCRSGTVLDLPFVYSSKGHIKNKSLFRQASEGLLDITTNHKGGTLKLLSSFMNFGQGLIKTREVESHHRELNTSKADVILFSGCDDNEISKVANVSNESVGAVSYAFMRTLKEKPDQTYQELLQNIRRMTVLKYDQTPQLSSSHSIDLKQKFIC